MDKRFIFWISLALFLLFTVFASFLIFRYKFSKKIAEPYVFGEIVKCDENKAIIFQKREHRHRIFPMFGGVNNTIILDFDKSEMFINVVKEMEGEKIKRNQSPFCNAKAVTVINPQKKGKLIMAKIVIFSEDIDNPTLLKLSKLD